MSYALLGMSCGRKPVTLKWPSRAARHHQGMSSVSRERVFVSVEAASLLTGKSVEGCISARIRIDGREYINFFGHGYLALAQVPEIRRAVVRVLEQGVPFARQMPAVVGGCDPIFAAVEQAAAAACGTQAAVYVASGYLIGAVALRALEGTFDVLLLDTTAHYNLRDAAALSECPIFTFNHCDAQSLREVLRRHTCAKQRPLVVTDGVFATTGRIPPLAHYAEVLSPYDGGRLFVDEAHSFGVVGENGRGAAEYCGVEHLTPATGATLSKAFCAQGAIVGCSTAAAARLESLPPVRGACAGSTLSAVAATASLAYVAGHPHLRSDLRVITEYFRARLRSIGVEMMESPAPIVSFRWGKRIDMLELQRRLFDRGIYIYYSTYIGAGSEGLIRCAVFRDHTREDIDQLIAALE